MKKIVLIGYGGHANGILDTIRQKEEYEVVGYTDNKPLKENTKYPYLGNDDVLQRIFDEGVHYAAICVGYLGNSNIRDVLYGIVKTIGFQIPAIIDKTAILADDILIGEGSYIGKGAIVNAKSNIGKMCIINSGAVIEHESHVKDFTHVSVNAVLCCNVVLEDHVFIGANATIIQDIQIHHHSRIGAGSVILKDVPKEMTVYGIWKGSL